MATPYSNRYPEINPSHPKDYSYLEKPKIQTPLTIQSLFPQFNRWAIGFDPLLITCFEGLIETKHPYSFIAN